MTNEIKYAIHSLLENRTIVQSWGITNIIVKQKEIRFEVNGFLFQGLIIIKQIYNKQYLVSNGGKDIKCDLFQLVSTLDRIIEADDNYLETLEQYFNSNF